MSFVKAFAAHFDRHSNTVISYLLTVLLCCHKLANGDDFFLKTSMCFNFSFPPAPPARPASPSPGTRRTSRRTSRDAAASADEGKRKEIRRGKCQENASLDLTFKISSDKVLCFISQIRHMISFSFNAAHKSKKNPPNMQNTFFRRWLCHRRHPVRMHPPQKEKSRGNVFRAMCAVCLPNCNPHSL